MSETPRASRHLGRRRPLTRSAPRVSRALCLALLAHLIGAEVWSTPKRRAPPDLPSLRWQVEAREPTRARLSPPRPAALTEPPEPLERPEPEPQAPLRQPWFEDLGVSEERPLGSEAWAANAVRSPAASRRAAEERALRLAAEAPPPSQVEAASAQPTAEIPTGSAPSAPLAAAAEATVAGGAVREARPLASAEPPSYPPLALRHGWEGRVQLRVFIGADGRVRELELLSSSGVPLLDRTAESAVIAWRFEPARDMGRAVASSTTVSLRFELRDAQVTRETQASAASPP